MDEQLWAGVEPKLQLAIGKIANMDDVAVLISRCGQLTADLIRTENAVYLRSQVGNSPSPQALQQFSSALKEEKRVYEERTQVLAQIRHHHHF